MGALGLCAGYAGEALKAAVKKPGEIASFLLLTAIFGTVRFIKVTYPALLPVNETVFFALMMLGGSLRGGSGPFLKFGGKLTIGAAGLFAAACLFHPLGREALVFAAHGLARSVPFLILNRTMTALMSQDKLVPVPPGELSHGMILSDGYLKKLETAAPDFYKENFKTMYPDGLSGEQAELLKGFLGASPENELSAIDAHVCFPFAGWITAGALLTAVFQGETVLTLLRSLY